MSEAVELYRQDGTATGVFYCSECRAVFPNQEQASTCHRDRFCACGAKVERRFYAKCNACDHKEWKEKAATKERERFEAARKIPASEYEGGMIFGPDDKYYTEIEDCIDGYLVGQEPEYVWACKDVGVVQATTESLYENMLENMWEDAEVTDLNGIDELEVAVTAFNEANKSISVWEPDYSTAILVGPPFVDRKEVGRG